MTCGKKKSYSTGGILRLWNPKIEVELVLLKNIRALGETRMAEIIVLDF
jgi:hypothetical protein